LRQHWKNDAKLNLTKVFLHEKTERAQKKAVSVPEFEGKKNRIFRKSE